MEKYKLEAEKFDVIIAAEPLGELIAIFEESKPLAGPAFNRASLCLHAFQVPSCRYAALCWRTLGALRFTTPFLTFASNK